MTKNTPEAMKKVVEKLIVDLEQIQDCYCSEWECEECPFHFTEIVEDLYYASTCGWLLLKSVSRKIMRK